MLEMKEVLKNLTNELKKVNEKHDEFIAYMRNHNKFIDSYFKLIKRENETLNKITNKIDDFLTNFSNFMLQYVPNFTLEKGQHDAKRDEMGLPARNTQATTRGISPTPAERQAIINSYQNSSSNGRNNERDSAHNATNAGNNSQSLSDGRSTSDSEERDFTKSRGSRRREESKNLGRGTESFAERREVDAERRETAIAANEELERLNYYEAKLTDSERREVSQKSSEWMTLLNQWNKSGSEFSIKQINKIAESHNQSIQTAAKSYEIESQKIIDSINEDIRNKAHNYKVESSKIKDLDLKTQALQGIESRILKNAAILTKLKLPIYEENQKAIQNCEKQKLTLKLKSYYYGK